MRFRFNLVPRRDLEFEIELRVGRQGLSAISPWLGMGNGGVHARASDRTRFEQSVHGAADVSGGGLLGDRAQAYHSARGGGLRFLCIDESSADRLSVVNTKQESL